ncbi:MAG: MoxR family ATPase [Deltaproteobacteria bacterium]|nr:MoxR family ATPase [Deltaproteobacteria bacterium]MCB9488955.1 MoxR family ATPase [Deltaproteobacteria bacterium]
MPDGDLYARLTDEIRKVIAGQDDAIELALAAFFAGGHVLLEGVPGIGKTLIVRTVAAALNMEFRRVQMTPDLLPYDITGSAIYREDRHEFEFQRGPIFTNFLLADEINRAGARTQSALLEAMQELTVTQDGRVHALPEPFIVFATQNPIEQEGTYPLPQAQLDRFMFKIDLRYPDASVEEEIFKRHHATGMRDAPTQFAVEKVIEAADILAARSRIRETFVRDEVVAYVRALVQATRDADEFIVGASTRAGLMLLMGAKSLARFADRDFVTPDDIQRAFLPTMRHRLVLSPDAELEGLPIDDALDDILASVEVPR